MECLESMVRKNTWMRTTSVIVMVTLWECCSKSDLITIMFKVLSKQLWGILTTTYERHFPVKDLNIMKQKLAKMPAKSSFSPKYKPVLQISLHQNQKQNLAFHWLLYTFFFFQANLGLRFIAVLMKQFLSQFI